MSPKRAVRETALSPYSATDLPGFSGHVATQQASAARQEFFTLLEDAIRRHPGDITLIHHKDLPEPAALVNARVLFDALALLRRLMAERGEKRPFALRGSLKHWDVAPDALDELRATRRAEQERRQREMR